MEIFNNLSNVHLICEVQENAFCRTKGYINIALIMCILDYVEIASIKNVDGLLKEIDGYPRDIPLFDITIRGIEAITSGMETEELVEILTKDYWDNPVKDCFAFEKYMGILGILMIKEKFSIARVQQSLLKQLVLRNQTAWKGEEWIEDE